MVVIKPNTNYSVLPFLLLVYIYVPPSDNQSIFVALSQDSSAGHAFLCKYAIRV
jgi:hypothetical protein